MRSLYLHLHDRVDLQTGQMRPIGKHNDAISCLSVVSRHEVVSGSWDSTARMWDVRSASSQETLSLPDKVFAMDVHRESHTLVVATAQRHMYVYDLRSLSNGPFQKRLSPLKLSTRSLRIMPYGQGFAVGSIEGRIALEYFDQGENDKSKYAFKCHREVDSDGQDCVYPVHALAFHEKYAKRILVNCI